MAYTTIDKPSDYFETKLYSGNGGTQSITGLDFAPNWVWTKGRSGTYSAESHKLYDTVRGTTKELRSDVSNAESTNSTGVTSFNSDGYALGADGGMNGSSTTYVSWNWKAGTSFTNDASSTGIGTIDSNGSVSSDAGFGIVKWSGTGSAGTIAHNMGSTPSYLIIKRLSDANWLVQATTLGYGNFLALNTTAASSSASTLVTGVSSTLVTLGNNGSVNGSGQNYIGYFFSEKKGYSKFGSYTGNGNADGTFVYTGFKPAFVLYKKFSGTENWFMHDNKRQGYNPDNEYLFPDLSNVEGSLNRINLLSNGFKATTSDGGINGSGSSYIYMAFAENPFVTSTGVPATAR